MTDDRLKATRGGLVPAACWLAAILATVAAAGAQQAKAPAKAAAPKPVAVLHGSSVWRVLYSLNAPQVRTDEGLKEPGGRKKFDFMTIYPPTGWVEVDFDDAAWARQHFGKHYNGELDVRSGSGGPNLNIRQISLRGKFTVTDPSAVKDLKLTLLFRGGAAVYVNGREIARANLPKNAGPGDPGEIYPEKAYLKPNGKPWHWYSDREAIKAGGVYELRVRRIEGLPVPPGALRKGINVLAVEIHAAPFPPAFAKPKIGPPWSAAGLCELRLMTAQPEVVVPNVLRPKGVQVWNANIVEVIGPNSYGDPHEPLKPIRLVTARNGATTGRVVLSSDGDIKGLKADLSPLVGPGGRKLPPSAARVRYGRLCSLNGSARRDDALLDAPPALLSAPPLPKRDRWTPIRHKARTDDGLPPEITPGAIQSVLVTVQAPKSAAPGHYEGTLTISVRGRKDVRVPVELDLGQWTIPDPSDFAFWFGLVESPEGVALHYDVPLWSDRHLALLDGSFRLIARTGGKVLFIHLTAETEYGNERSMVTWQKGRDGKLTADLSAVEKFVTAAVRHFKPTFVPVCLWQWPDSGKAPLITVLDPGSGRLENVPGPVNGTDEAMAFWKPVLLGVKGILDKAGLGDRMLLATGSDRYPKKETLSVFAKILPQVGWEAHRHFPLGGEWMPAQPANVPVKYIASVWGQWDNWDPDDRRVYGWKYSRGKAGTLWTWLDRGTYDPASFTRFRTICEQVLLANRRGLGQIGADFWPPRAGQQGRYRRSTLYSRFPRSANVGGGNKGCTTNQLFYPGPDGPVPTVRYELIRENIQECEARIFLERLLTAGAAPKSAQPESASPPGALPADLAARCQAVLDERTRWHRIGYSLATGDVSTFWPYSGWEGRTARLYRVAGEAAGAAAK